ncbi:MAG: ABC transporter permease [Acidobacteriota bacterium]
MKLELFVALRYLKARRKQAVVSVISLISILGVAAGVMALVIALALNTGFQEEFQRRILGATSHVNLLRLGGGPLDDYEAVLAKVSGIPGVIEVTPTIYGQCLLQASGRQEPAVVKGVDSDAAPDLIPRLREGDLAKFGAAEDVPSLIVGKDLAETLAISAGEYVRALGLSGELSPLGRMPRRQNFRIAAIFESGLWDYDAHWALMPLKDAQKFLGLREDEVSTLEFRIRDLYQAPEIAAKVKALAGPGYTTSTWIELNRPLFSALRLEKLAMFVAIGLIILVAALNIIGTLTLMVMEKSRDIAIITAMGGTSRILTRVFILQGLIIGIVGTVLGDVLGVVSAWYLDTYKVFRLEPQVYAIPYVPFRWTVPDLLLISAAALLISFLATLYPARAAARLDPVEALRYE